MSKFESASKRKIRYYERMVKYLLIERQRLGLELRLAKIEDVGPLATAEKNELAEQIKTTEELLEVAFHKHGMRLREFIAWTFPKDAWSGPDRDLIVFDGPTGQGQGHPVEPSQFFEIQSDS